MADLTKSLTDVETGILGALETLDRLDEFLLPHPVPDNQGLGVNLCVRSFSLPPPAMRFARSTDQTHSLLVPCLVSAATT